MSEKASSFIAKPMVLRDEVAAIECQQPFPMPLGGVAVVDRALWEREAVMGAGIEFDLVFGSLHAFFHLLDDFRRRIDIGFGATEIKFGLGLAGRKMRAVGLIGRQLHAVDRRR